MNIKQLLRKSAYFFLNKNKSPDPICLLRTDGTLYHQHSVEIQVVDHCNRSCEGCNHLSPIMPKRFESPEQVSKDLNSLKTYLRVRTVKLIGGEPLLHPKIEEIARAVDESGIAEEIMLVTNGILLSRISNHLLQRLTKIEISQYPHVELPKETIEKFKKKAQRLNVTVNILHYPNFQNSFSFHGTKNMNLVKRIFKTCRKVQLWGCHTAYEGYLFRCPQSLYLAKTVPALKMGPFWLDGLKLTSSENFQATLVSFLTGSTPLKACQYCVGNVGKIQTHRLCNSESWQEIHEKPTEDIIDYRLLVQAENDITIRSGCRTNKYTN
jgi:organic radical activating enzyme